MKPCTSFAAVSLRMWKGLSLCACKTRVLLLSPRCGGHVGRNRTECSRASTYAFSTTKCYSVSPAPTDKDLTACLGSTPPVLGANLKPALCIGGSSEHCGRTLRYHSTCNKKAPRVESEIPTSGPYVKPRESNGGDRKFIWRTVRFESEQTCGCSFNSVRTFGALLRANLVQCE